MMVYHLYFLLMTTFRTFCINILANTTIKCHNMVVDGNENLF